MIAVKDLVALVLLILAGLPAAYLIAGSWKFAAVLAPLVTGVISAFATMLMLLAGGRLIWWLAVLITGQVVAAVILIRRAKRPALPHTSWIDVFWYVAPLLPPFLLVTGPPKQWDASAIWWMHAAYFSRSADVARDAMADPNFAFTHTDYPPLASAPVGAVWNVVGFDLSVAQFVSSLLTFAAIAMLSYAVRRVTANGVPAWVARFAGVAVALTVWGQAPLSPAGGMSDPLWAATFVAGVALMLLPSDPFARPALPILLLSVAALTKNEGFVAVLLLVPFVLLRQRRNLRPTWVMGVPVLAGAFWALIARHVGAVSDVQGGRFGDLLHGSPEVLHRLHPTLTAINNMIGHFMVLSLVVAALGLLFLRRRRRDLQLGSDLWLWMLNTLFTASLIMTYLISKNNLSWYLLTSLDRVTLPIVLLAALSTACWATVAVSRQPDRVLAEDAEVVVPKQLAPHADATPDHHGPVDSHPLFGRNP